MLKNKNNYKKLVILMNEIKLYEKFTIIIIKLTRKRIIIVQKKNNKLISIK